MKCLIYSIQREIINPNLAFAFWFYIYIYFFSFDISFSQMAVKKDIWSLQPIDFLINCLFSLYELSSCYA